MKEPSTSPSRRIVQEQLAQVKFSFLHPQPEDEAAPRPRFPKKVLESFEIRSFTLTSEGRTRHSLIPTGDARSIPTGLLLSFPDTLHPFVSTPDYLWDLRLKAEGIAKDPETGELLVRISSFRHDSYHLPHDSLLCRLFFGMTVIVDPIMDEGAPE